MMRVQSLRWAGWGRTAARYPFSSNMDSPAGGLYTGRCRPRVSSRVSSYERRKAGPMLRTKLAWMVLLTLVSVATAPGRTAVAAEPHYKLIKEIPIGGGGGWDYLTADAAGRRLYVTHGTKVVVIDTDADKVVGEITDTPGV